ncbi:hypothetical protein C8Q74DRAFT_1439774 [Fomes fomentarius]|nr:hypothetical protein C8Q74DRAFT_1439774 [Fomes fomentarius]
MTATFWGQVCDTRIVSSVIGYFNCRPDQGGQTGPSGYQSSPPHGSDPTPLTTGPAQDRTTTRTFLTTAETEMATYTIPSSSTSLHGTSTYSSPGTSTHSSPGTHMHFPDVVPASPSHIPPKSIQSTSVSTATATVTIASDSLNPPSTVTQTSTSIVESTQRRGAGLSAGATAGIIVAVLVFVLLASAVSWLLWKRRRRLTTALSHNLPGGSTSALWQTSYGDEALPPYVPSQSVEGAKRPVSEKTNLPALPQYGYTLDEPQVQYGSEIACDDGTSIYGPDDISRLSPLRPLRRVE